MTSDMKSFLAPVVFLQVLMLLAFACCLCASILVTVKTADPDANQRTIDAFARDLYPPEQGFATRQRCSFMDTDGDGYVSCTIVVTSPDGSVDTEPFECSPIFETCRVQKPVARLRALGGR